VIVRGTSASVGRLLRVGAAGAFGLAVVGVVLGLAAGIDPTLAPSPPPSPGDWLAALQALDPLAFVWAAIGLTIALPTASVVLAAVGFTRAGDRRAAATAALVLVTLGCALLIAIVVG
jgi:uncharacterized membrane protein